jgi:general secretion pathway protein B
VSFILDALRKSEHERQRQAGPALAEVPVAPAKPRSNVWAPIVIALLLVNLAVIGVLMIRKSMREPVPPPPAAAIVGSTAAPTPVPVPAPVSPAPVSPAPISPAPVAQAPVTTVNPAASTTAMMRPAEPVTAARNEPRYSLEAEATGDAPTLDPQMAAQAAAVPSGPPAVTRTPSSRGSVVYESLPDSATVGGPQYTPRPGGNRPAQDGGSGLPPADQLSGSGAVPALNLDLHVYSTTPAERLVFINSRKYREGDTMQEGPVVRQITPAGAVIEYQGRSYLLTHD